MDRAEKRELVATLNQVFSNAGVVVVANYSGLTVAQMTSLRRQMSASGASLKVAKNRLAKIALEGTDVAHISAPFSRVRRFSLTAMIRWRRQGRSRLRQGQRQVRDPWRRSGRHLSECGRCEGSGHTAVARRVACEDRRPGSGSGDQARSALDRACCKAGTRVRGICQQRCGVRPFNNPSCLNLKEYLHG